MLLIRLLLDTIRYAKALVFSIVYLKLKTYWLNMGIKSISADIYAAYNIPKRMAFQIIYLGVGVIDKERWSIIRSIFKNARKVMKLGLLRFHKVSQRWIRSMVSSKLDWERGKCMLHFIIQPIKRPGNLGMSPK